MCPKLALLWKLLAGHLGASDDRRIRAPLRDVVDQLRAAIYQRLPGTDDGHMSLRVFAPVLEWVQELRVHSCQASEVFGVYLVGLALV